MKYLFLPLDYRLLGTVVEGRGFRGGTSLASLRNPDGTVVTGHMIPISGSKDVVTTEVDGEPLFVEVAAPTIRVRARVRSVDRSTGRETLETAAITLRLSATTITSL